MSDDDRRELGIDEDPASLANISRYLLAQQERDKRAAERARPYRGASGAQVAEWAEAVGVTPLSPWQRTVLEHIYASGDSKPALPFQAAAVEYARRVNRALAYLIEQPCRCWRDGRNARRECEVCTLTRILEGSE